MGKYLLLLTLAVAVASAAQSDTDAAAKTVLGPRNIWLYDGANALLANDAVEGVKLTLKGLEFAHGAREEKLAHTNLCAGFVMLEQPETALEHCNWVIERDPYSWRTYNNRALAYLALKRYAESEADIERGQELNPRSKNLKEVKGIYLDEVEPVTEQITVDDRRQPPDAADEPEE